MYDFEEYLDRLEELGFCDDYRKRLKEEYRTGDADSVWNYVRAIVVVYDDRREFVDAV